MSQDAEVPVAQRKARTINDLPEDWQFILRRKRKKGQVANLPDGSIWKTDHMMVWRELAPPVSPVSFKNFDLGHMYRKARGFTRAELREMKEQDEEKANGTGRDSQSVSGGVGQRERGVGEAAPRPADLVL